MGLYRANCNEMNKQIMQMDITWLKILSGRRQISWLFTIVVEELSVYRETTPAKSSERDLNLGHRDFNSGALSNLSTTLTRCLWYPRKSCKCPRSSYRRSRNVFAPLKAMAKSQTVLSYFIPKCLCKMFKANTTLCV